jgi:hypothetical protein
MYVILFVFSHYSLIHCCVVQALEKGAQCPQQTNTSSAAFNNIIGTIIPGGLGALFGAAPSSEDCAHNHFMSLRRLHVFTGLTLDIIVPAGTTASSKLPVLFVSPQLFFFNLYD